jgi:hypothetical protein
VEAGVAEREGAAVDVEVVRRGRAGRLEVPVPVEFRELHGDLAVLGAPGDPVVVRAEDAVPAHDAPRAVVAAEPGRVGSGVAAVREDDPGDVVVRAARDLPAPATAVAGPVAPRGVLDERALEVPDRRIRRILGPDDDRLSRGCSPRQVDAEPVRPRGQDHLVAGLRRLDLRVRVGRADLHGGGAGAARRGEDRQPGHQQSKGTHPTMRRRRGTAVKDHRGARRTTAAPGALGGRVTDRGRGPSTRTRSRR